MTTTFKTLLSRPAGSFGSDLVYRRIRTRRTLAIGGATTTAAWAALAVLISGCGVGAGSGSSGPGETNTRSWRESDDIGNPVDTSETPTELFGAQALVWEIPVGSSTSVSGTISQSRQVVVYDIGPVYGGDRIKVEVIAQSDLDPAVAIFDTREDVLMANDDRAYYSGLTDSVAETTLRHDESHLYVVVSDSPRSHSTGAYTLRVILTEEDLPEAPASQRFYLNFHGAAGVRIGSRAAIDVPVFDAASIDSDFAGHTEEIIENVLALVNEDYTGIDVEFYGSHEGFLPPEPYTTIHFGTYDAELLGVAENIDEYNRDQTQDAVIFTDTFAAFSVLNPSIEEISRALANVTSHEAGHLLGLYHTSDVHGIMDITASLRQMLGNQYLARSPLEAGTFPVGHQDATRTVIANVGGSLEAAKQASRAQREKRSPWYDQDIGPSARTEWLFSTCAPIVGVTANDQANESDLYPSN